jgi:hypothetical protein
VQDGGIILWIHTNNDEDKAKAEAILQATGGQHVHEPAGR